MEDEKRIQTCQRRYYAGTNYRLNKYGYIVVSPLTEEEDALVRKITPMQRRCIILYWIKTCRNKPFNVPYFAKKLGYNERNIQYDLKYLKRNGHIAKFVQFDEKTGAQLENVYVFRKQIDNPFYRLKPTLRKVYGKANYLGLREWHWDDYKTIPGMTDEYHTAFDKRENFEELNEKKARQKRLKEKAEYDNFATFKAVDKRINRYLVNKK